MIKLTIIGSGNVAFHLIEKAKEISEISLIQVIARNLNALQNLNIEPGILCDFSGDLKSADVYLIAVSDDSISEVSQKLSIENKLVVHCSGTNSLKRIDKKNRRGVWYPLQSFSKEKTVDFKTIPICIEAEHQEDEALLKKLAKLYTDKVHIICEAQRQQLHLAAVFANNFSNQMFAIAEELCIQKQIPFEVLSALTAQTFEKIRNNSPKKVQTGPAIRKDHKTIEKHIEALLHQPLTQEIYKLITQSIQETHEQKL